MKKEEKAKAKAKAREQAVIANKIEKTIADLPLAQVAFKVLFFHEKLEAANLSEAERRERGISLMEKIMTATANHSTPMDVIEEAVADLPSVPIAEEANKINRVKIIFIYQNLATAKFSEGERRGLHTVLVKNMTTATNCSDLKDAIDEVAGIIYNNIRRRGLSSVPIVVEVNNGVNPCSAYEREALLYYFFAKLAAANLSEAERAEYTHSLLAKLKSPGTTKANLRHVIRKAIADLDMEEANKNNNNHNNNTDEEMGAAPPSFDDDLSSLSTNFNSDRLK